MIDGLAGSLLREARRRARLSQVELARRASVAQSVVSAYESGARQPSLPTLARLVSATGLDLDVRVRRPPSGLSRLSGPLGRRLRKHRRRVQRITTAHGLSNVRVFGSVARGEDTTDSDIDLLVDVSAGVGLIGMARCQHDLQSLLDAQVDLVPADDLKPGVARSVLAEVVAL
ncbi:MAG: helix-turn-helix domain-containing protein [Actinomycetes bacterium]